ncbi:MAG: metallophosphoesterase [Hyphomicrobiales bacterium]|nr:MAG: metallophosphoesterase [Hyphomicrobiales bacterium]
MITRRQFIKYIGASFVAGIGGAGYAFGIEPLIRLGVSRYRLTPKGWPTGLKLKIAALSDFHISQPWLSLDRLATIIDRTNELRADLIVLLGDYSAGISIRTGEIHSHQWAPLFGRLQAPLGVHAILGNHDWWHDRTAQKTGTGPTFGQLALKKAGIPVYENEAIRLNNNGMPFWLLGLGDQLALRADHANRIRHPQAKNRGRWLGRDDLTGTIDKITDDAPAILLAHEPDIFVDVPSRISLTLSGHTHGGQVRLAGWSPVVPSYYGNRFAYGHVVENDRHLIVSGGLGTSILPVRFGIPPEIVLVELG